RKDGSRFIIERRGRTIEYQGRPMRVAVLKDITERKQAEEDLNKAQAQLVQSQKMESVGRLAGGIAHDFNNILTAILGYCNLLEKGLAKPNHLSEYVDEIGIAAGRAAELTKQLLAFSRQQMLDFKVINLNSILNHLNKMLGRVLGEDIEIILNLAPNL